MDTTKKFSKELWLISANSDKDNGILTQREIDDAIKIWVDNLNGKTVEEILALNPTDQLVHREEWFE